MLLCKIHIYTNIIDQQSYRISMIKHYTVLQILITIIIIKSNHGACSKIIIFKRISQQHVYIIKNINCYL
jgi:hypothetical protein